MKRWMKILVAAGMICFLAGMGVIFAAAAGGGNTWRAETERWLDHHGGRYYLSFLFRHGREAEENVAEQAVGGERVDSDPRTASVETSGGAGSRILQDAAQALEDGAGYAFYDEAGRLLLSPKEEMELWKTLTGITKLELSAEYCAVRVTEQSEEPGVIRIYRKPDSRLRLELEQERSGEAELDFEYDGAHRGEPDRVGEVLVELPAGFCFQTLELKSTAGAMEIGGLKTDRLTLEAEAGSLISEGFDAGYAQLETEAGSLTASGTVQTGLKAETEAGRLLLTLEGSASDFSPVYQSTLGSVRVGSELHTWDFEEHHGEEIHHGTGEAVTDSGAQSRQPSAGAIPLTIECNAGTVEIDFTE